MLSKHGSLRRVACIAINHQSSSFNGMQTSISIIQCDMLGHAYS